MSRTARAMEMEGYSLLFSSLIVFTAYITQVSTLCQQAVVAFVSHSSISACPCARAGTGFSLPYSFSPSLP